MRYNRYLIYIFITVFFWGCFTISVNFSGAQIHPDVKTFSIQSFINRADFVQPGLTQELEEALRDKVESQTSLKMVNGIGDINFEGEIYTDNITSKSLTAQEVAAQNRYTIGVRIKYSNIYDPDNEFEKNFERFEDFPGSESPSGARSEYTEEIIKNLIDDIFKEAFVNW